MEALVFVDGGTLGSRVSASEVPVDADGLAFQGDQTGFCTTFCPNCLTVSKLDEGGGFLVEEEVVPLLCADEADSAGGGLAAA